MHIYLIGFMGAGKTTIGKLLAKELGRDFLDLDESIEQKAGLSIPEIFQMKGEEFFRELESKSLQSISSSPAKVIATGGGAFLAETNRVVMKNSGISIYLKWSVDVLFDRIRNSQNRPLLQDPARENLFNHIQTMLNERQLLYELADIIVHGDEHTSPEQSVAMILDRLPQDIFKKNRVFMKQLHVNLGERTYPLILKSDSLAECGKEIQRRASAKTYIIITDENVDRHYSQIVTTSIEKTGSTYFIYKITPGEESKSMRTAEAIYTWMLAHRFHREVVVIALGGGVVGDLAGFIAATYLRGVRFVQIPTSLLAQVDSSVGGKVGINHPLAKNCIGAFYQPRLVWIDPTTLRTLPVREIYNGLAEVIKYGLILDAPFFDYLETNLDAIISLENMNLLIEVIHACCRLKADVVEKDEKESGLRRVLNFGHTIGHALEKLTDYVYFRHGEAVVWGMLAATIISERACGLSSAASQKIKSMLERLEKPSVPSTITADQIFDAIKVDKKMTEAGLQFVLLEEIGTCKIQAVADEVIFEGIEGILKK